MSKVFGIGLPRTATASLCEALKILGYNVRHYPKYKSRVAKFEAITDSPIPLYYKELDKEYPGSKFILTVRNIDDWIKSMEKSSRRFRWHKLSPEGRCGPEVYECHMKLLGCTGFDKHKMMKGYYNHYLDVCNHFLNRPDDLLVFNLCGGEGWDLLCPFLDKKDPECDMPNRNKSKK